jgi:chromosome segregation ATPase
MTKENLQKELLAKVKPGLKPSDIKRLKRSKSANDLPNSLPEQEAFLKELWLLLHPQTKSLSLNQPINQEELKKALKSQLNQLKGLQPNPALLEKKQALILAKTKLTNPAKRESWETEAGIKDYLKKLEREINELEPPLPLVQEQLKEKQEQIEALRAQLEQKSTELAHTKSELDQSLEARCQALTTFGHAHEKRNKAEQELDETVEEASNELKHGDQETSRLRSELFKANQQVNSLQHELNLARINRHKNLPDSPLELPFNYWSYALYAWLALWFMALLNRPQPQEN